MRHFVKREEFFCSNDVLVKFPCENFFQAIVTYESGRKTGELPKILHRLGKALARGSDFKAIAGAAMNCPSHFVYNDLAR